MNAPFTPLPRLTGAACAAMLAACTSLSGLDGTASYGCKAPEGVRCDSLSGTYHNAQRNNLPSQRRAPASPASDPVADPAASPRATAAMVSTAAGPARAQDSQVHAPAALRSAPRILQLWVKPWEDADRDLNGESLVWVQVDDGRWLVDHVQRQAREPYAPVRPAGLGSPSSDTADRQAPQTNPLSPVDRNGPVSAALRALQPRAPAPAGN